MCRVENFLCKPYRIGLVLGLAALLSASTCTVIGNLNGCQDAFTQPQIGTLSPNPMSADTVLSCWTWRALDLSRNPNPVEQKSVAHHVHRLTSPASDRDVADI